nr:ketose-bisphosphate aldolase class-II family protein [Tanacetum cinerariifolium]
MWYELAMLKRKSEKVIELLKGIHFVASVEAISLGVQAGIHPWILYDIISNAAGNSWIYKNYIPLLLQGNKIKDDFLNASAQRMGIVLDTAKSLTFPLPLLAAAHQQFLAGSRHADAIGLDGLKVWERVFGVQIMDAANAETYNPELLANQLSAKSKQVNNIGFIGLGAMGFGMATHLLKSNFSVHGFDVYKPTLSRFAQAGGLIGSSPAEVSKDVDVLIVMVTNEVQAESVLYGVDGAVSELNQHAQELHLYLTP